MGSALALTGTATAALLLANRLLADYFALFMNLIVEEFLLHGGRDDHHLVVAVTSRLDQFAHPNLARKTVLFPLQIPLQQMIKGLIGHHSRDWRRARLLQELGIVVSVQR